MLLDDEGVAVACRWLGRNAVAPRGRPGVGCLAALAYLAAEAQTAPPAAAAEARIQPMDRAQAQQARLKALVEAAPAPYQDRFMSADEAGAASADDSAVPSAQPEGFRAWMTESRIGFGAATSSGAGRRRAVEFGQRIEYRRETLNHGEFLLQADGRRWNGDRQAQGGIGVLGYAEDAGSGRLTLRNLAFPLTPRTFADSALGDIHSELTEGLARHYRLSLGSTTVRGASLRVFDAGSDWRAGFGMRGSLRGGPYPGFEQSQGTLGWLGLTQRVGGNGFVAAQLNRARDLPAWTLDPFTGQGLGSRHVESWAGALGWGREVERDGDFKVRATLIGSRTRSPTPGVAVGDSRGLFVEASARLGPYRHEFGAYTTRPNLFFGDHLVADGTRGAYWRVDRGGSRLHWGGGLEHERTQGDAAFGFAGSSRSGANGSFLYQFDRHASVGGSLSLQRTRYDSSANTAAGSDSRSLYASVFHQARFFGGLRSRFSLTVRRNELIVLGDQAATGHEWQWEQDWIGAGRETLRPELTTTLGYARDRSGGVPRNYPTAGVQFLCWLDSGFHLGGNLRYTSQSGGLHTSRGLSGSLTAEKALARGWRIGFAAYFNQARAAVAPTTSLGPQLYRSNDRSAYVYLRWEGSAGTAFQTAGVRDGDAGAGAGSVAGQVFFDANRDGARQPDEDGAAHVEVQLDGRYRTTTDRDGRFEFPLVTTGRHRLSLTLDSVPLPWGAAGDGGVTLGVPLRGRAVAEIPLTKVGE
ncbi:carboxypeptidase-like regulatory domain-containing protein [Variovorax sp. PDC80]|uniref:carboxypeptidase-like regulatory domain-containing protein n=1 Tax=Variovorax sp. PDC80 TaxID=1882827 RepID=UPI0011604498|nr:carboxypeptidase-like regulatory domain-containing protein [Variovorax sp. PDC80]